MSSSSNLHDSLVDLKSNIDQTFENILSIWIDIYGDIDAKKPSRMDSIKNKYMSLGDELIQQEQNRKDILISRVEQSLEKKSQLEKLLKLDRSAENVDNNDAPLVELDMHLLTIIDKYNIIKDSRLETLAKLQEKEKGLCGFLDKSPQVFLLENGVVPSETELNSIMLKIKNLEQEKAALIDTFTTTKAQFAALFTELGVEFGLSKIERCVMSENEELFPISKINLEKLKEKLGQYQQTKENNIAEAEDLREQLRIIWTRIKRDPKELNTLLIERSGYSKADIMILNSKLKECKAIRKKFLKEVIESARTELEELWDKCCISEYEKELFEAYKADIYTEDILTLHEMEIDRLKRYYEHYNEIYKLIESRKTMWNRLEQLEDMQKDPSRLFSNRGGMLLMEEKERKKIQKDLPKIENKLNSQITEFENHENKPFLYYGENVRDVIERDWSKKNAQKENEIRARKIANIKTIETESKLGAKPLLSAKKRKLGTSQTQLVRKIQKTNSTSSIIQSKQINTNHHMLTPMSAVIPRTPKRMLAVSTPDLSGISSIASYNTFQENLNPRTPKYTVSTPARSAKKTPSQVPIRTPMATRSQIPQFYYKF